MIKSNKIKIEEGKNPLIYNRLLPQNYCIGDEIIIGTESFYVISQTSTQLKAISKWNLLVGFEWSESPLKYTSLKKQTGLQDSSARGEIYDYEFSNLHDNIGVVQFSNKIKPFSGDINLKEVKNNLYKYLKAYKRAIEKLGIIIDDISLITLDELIAIGYESYIVEDNDIEMDVVETNKVKYRATRSVPNWIYQTSYWTRTPGKFFKDWMFVVSTSGSVFEETIFNHESYGIRPVITISKDQLNKNE